MEHCPCPKHGMIYRPDMYNLQVKKKKNIWKMNKSKIQLSDNVTIKQTPILNVEFAD